MKDKYKIKAEHYEDWEPIGELDWSRWENLMKGNCPNCSRDLYKRHCKLVCERCGVIYDCSDPFR